MLPTLRAVRRGLAACVAIIVAIIVALTVAGCTSSKHASTSSSASSASPSGSSPATAAATRWWSNSAATVGTTIDPANPGAAAAKLHPSQTEYCGMLKQTLDARKSILPTAGTSDPALLSGAEAFAAEIQQVAPAGITASWHVLGPAIIGLIKSGGQVPTGAAGQTAKTLQAAQAVSADAKATCKLDLTAIVTGG